jgi:UDP-3-O-[3-hydroxymyristoyl] glucosamine N-acyltransferase
MPDSRFFLTGAPLAPRAAAGLAGADLLRDHGGPVSRVAAIGETDLVGALVFAESRNDAAPLKGRPFGLCLTTPAIADGLEGVGAVAVMAAPRLGFARVAAALHVEREPDDRRGVSPDARIAEGARIHETAVVAAGAEIGARARICANAIVGPGVVIGPDAVVGPGAVVMHAIIGARAAVLAGAVIGEAGFGFSPGPEGLVRFPQLGRVVIGADVEIGANSTIDRGALGDTVIADGVKIDNLVQIGHNVRIGPHTVIAALVGVSGSTVIGAGALVGGQVGIAEHLRVGDGAQLAAQSGVMHDVPAGEKWGGSPAKAARVWLREIAALAKFASRKTDG